MTPVKGNQEERIFNYRQQVVLVMEEGRFFLVWEQVARERGFYCCFLEIFWGGISLAWHASKGQVFFFSSLGRKLGR